MKTAKTCLVKFQCVQIVGRISWLLVAWIVPLSTFGQATPTSEQAATSAEATTEKAAAAAVSPAEAAPLDSVIKQVQAALDQYQNNLGGGADALPPLSSAEFDFKTTAGTTVGGTINLFIFKIGGSHKDEAINDVAYTYSVLPPPSVKGLGNKKPPTLTEALAKTIQSAAAAAKTATTMGKLKFSKLVITVQFGVTWSGNAGANVPINFVTVGLSGELSKNTVQSVKIVFGK